MNKHQKNIVLTSTISIASIFLSACLPQPLAPGFNPGDLRPPAVKSWAPYSEKEVQIVFDEAVADIQPVFANSPGPRVVSVSAGADEYSIIVELDMNQNPGEAYSISGAIADNAGNLTSFVLPYWGFNPNPPELLINELLTEGSATKPDALEFYALKAGNCAGLAFFVGVPGSYDMRYVFPPIFVEEGDYIILHLKPLGIDTEFDEFENKAASKGADTCDTAWDLWYRGDKGALSGKNGVVSLCFSPVGNYMDAVAYSERTIDSDSKYGGFGTSALLSRINALDEAGAWKFSIPPRPEDCARSAGTTGTRTICRSSDSFDSDSGSDWHVVPTKGKSLGAPNSDEVYEP